MKVPLGCLLWLTGFLAFASPEVPSLPYPGDRGDLESSGALSVQPWGETGPGGTLGFNLRYRHPGWPASLGAGGGLAYLPAPGAAYPGAFGELGASWKFWRQGAFGGNLKAGVYWQPPRFPGVVLGAGADVLTAGRTYLFTDISLILDGSFEVRPSFSAGLRLVHPLVSTFPAPQAELSLPAELFSPDGDGSADTVEFRFRVAAGSRPVRWNLTVSDPQGRKVWTAGGNGGPPEALRWDGLEDGRPLVESASEYSAVLSVEDTAGRIRLSHGTLETDILIIREGDRMRVRVPFIEFNPNAAALVTGDLGKMAANQAILEKLVAFFRKFPEYRVRIVGHGNILNWNNPAAAAAENRTVLKPLSLKRAESVRDALVQMGVESARMEVEGKGGDEPLVPFGKVEENWKNRRVEFILLKRVPAAGTRR